MEICICYQEKRKIKWFKDFINNKKQNFLVQLIFLIAYFQTFSIGTEVLYKEANENNNNQENIMLPLIVSFSFFTFVSAISGYFFAKMFKHNYFRLFKIKMQEINVDLTNSNFLGSMLTFTFNGIYAFGASILYFVKR